MAVTLTVTQLAARLRLGDGTTAPPEPVNGILTEYLALATDIVEEYANAAPDAAHNVAAARFCGYVYDSPTSYANNLFANALDNSGAASILSRYRVRRATIIDGDAPAGGVNVSTLGLARVATENVNIAAANVWVATSLAVPTAAVIGIEILFPDGTTSGVQLQRNILPMDPPVAAGDPSGGGSEYAIGRTAANRIALASDVTGTHTLTLWTVGV